jgi:hypothetical protein
MLVKPRLHQCEFYVDLGRGLARMRLKQQTTWMCGCTVCTKPLLKSAHCVTHVDFEEARQAQVLQNR